MLPVEGRILEMLRPAEGLLCNFAVRSESFGPQEVAFLCYDFSRISMKNGSPAFWFTTSRRAGLVAGSGF